MALFKRKQQGEVLPEEVQDYYRAEQRDRMGMAWLLAVGAFIATVLVVFGLFFAGRWVYRSLTGNGTDSGTSEQVQQEGAEEQTEATGGANDSQTDVIDLPGTPEEDDSDESEEEADSTNNEPDEQPQQQPAQGLPRTGPIAE